ncbi:5'-methylthioadenosine/adenosylhomocysteine nucleosidase [Spirochaeta lutea]|uniref:5'-methylthioadenosine/S-adenosylhomocysteine nucleosidase n=1 Tax=Spirochaeta lutea TaxID=1480694 RepID=A0A098QVZ8_9SPIO|nr:5'-methylthioadenosine/adenosylhomocysteine nucleosidase [Spirochaeta lutea]KGE71746.1 hypothetical protein DC28_10925 [Spirochaeta lutea]
MIGIIGAMEEEISLLLGELREPRTITREQFTFHTGLLRDHRVVILQCGIGKVNAAIGATLMIELFNPAFLVNTGAAGGIGPDLAIGDLIISREVIHHDVDVTAFGYQPGQIPGLPDRFTPDAGLLAAAQALLEHTTSFRGITGLVASGDVFMANPESLTGVLKRFPDVRAIEMEGAAIAQTCHQLGIPYLIIRAVSDRADEASTGDFEENLHLAARNSATAVCDLIEISHTITLEGEPS